MSARFSSSDVLRWILWLSLPVASLATEQNDSRDSEQDRQAVIALENEWLANLHNPEVLDRILAPDFRHAVMTGDFLTKEEHISWSVRHPPPANRKSRFDKLDVRIYGGVAIASGIVAATEDGKDIRRTIFTDIFAYRSGRWQAINAQETEIAKGNEH